MCKHISGTDSTGQNKEESPVNVYKINKMLLFRDIPSLFFTK